MERLRFLILVMVLPILFIITEQENILAAEDTRVIEEAKKVWDIKFNIDIDSSSISDGTIRELYTR